MVTRCVLAKQIQAPEVKSQHRGGATLLQLHISKTSGLGVCVLHEAKTAFLISWQELIANIVHGERFARGACQEQPSLCRAAQAARGREGFPRENSPVWGMSTRSKLSPAAA